MDRNLDVLLIEILDKIDGFPKEIKTQMEDVTLKFITEIEVLKKRVDELERRNG